MPSSRLLDASQLCSPETYPDHPYSSWPALAPSPRGRLELLTPAVTAAAAKSEIITGKRFSLDHSLFPSGALLYGRSAATHEVKRVDGGPRTLAEAGSGKGRHYHPVFDDCVTFNTQGTTQWDYFMHYSYRDSGLFYGGLTADRIQAGDTGGVGVKAISDAGGVQTRAILLDIPYYLSANGLPPLDPVSYPASTLITLELLQSVAKFCQVEPRVGDVLLVRTGFQAVIEKDMARPEGAPSSLTGNFAGVKQELDTLKWIWESGFVAVGSDNPTFEQWHNKVGAEPLHYHPILLSGMGIMIGELLRLDEVSKECQAQKRWSFFLSSQPLAIESGIASPCNAVAIF